MIKDSLLLSVVTIINLTLGLIGNVFLIRYLDVLSYGEYQYLLSWIAILSLFSLVHFNAVVTKAASQGYAQFFRKNNKIRVLFSLLGSFSLLFIGFFYKPEFSHYFYMAALFFPLFFGLNAVDAYLMGQNKFKAYSIFSLLSQLCVTSGLIITAFYFSSALYAFFSLLFVISLKNILLSGYYHRKEKLKERDVQTEKNLIKYGYELTSINLFTGIADKLQYIILERYTGSAILAIYAAAQLFPDRIKSIIKNGLNPISIYLSASKKEEGIKFLQKSFFFFFA